MEIKQRERVLRMSDLMQPMVFSKKLQAKVTENNRILQALGVETDQFSRGQRKLPGQPAKLCAPS